jgi:hypothetical protein
MSAGRTGEQKQENQQQQQNEKEKKPYVGFGFQDPSVREVPFIPAWETKIGQLQSSCYTLRRFSSEYLKTKY